MIFFSCSPMWLRNWNWFVLKTKYCICATKNIFCGYLSHRLWIKKYRRYLIGRYDVHLKPLLCNKFLLSTFILSLLLGPKNLKVNTNVTLNWPYRFGSWPDRMRSVVRIRNCIREKWNQIWLVLCFKKFFKISQNKFSRVST